MGNDGQSLSRPQNGFKLVKGIRKVIQFAPITLIVEFFHVCQVNRLVSGCFILNIGLMGCDWLNNFLGVS